MNKKIIITIIAVIVLVIIGGGIYFLLNNDQNNAPAETTESEEQVTTGDGNTNALVVYFSVPETDDPNKEMTEEEENSTVIVDGEVLGNTQYVANLISEYTGADIYRIEPETPYTTDHEALLEQAQEEQNNDARPAIKSRISNFDDYDTIYMGYPIWWSDMPQIMYSFMELYDFSGKTVIPFSTHGGSGLAGTVETISEKLNNSTVIDNAFTMSRNSMEDAPTEVESWLQEIGMLEE